MKLLLVIASFLIVNSCTSVKNKSAETKEANKVSLNFKAGPSSIIYKTKNNYYKLVPILLSDDKLKIVSFPHPSDIIVNGKFQYPTKLNNGFLLDNRGVSNNVAFLNISYEEYSKLETIPEIKKLFSMIIDSDPLLEIYNCGNRNSFKNEILDLNKLINNNELSRCKCLDK